jgi:hypothetical protein
MEKMRAASEQDEKDVFYANQTYFMHLISVTDFSLSLLMGIVFPLSERAAEQRERDTVDSSLIEMSVS